MQQIGKADAFSSRGDARVSQPRVSQVRPDELKRPAQLERLKSARQPTWLWQTQKSVGLYAMVFLAGAALATAYLKLAKSSLKAGPRDPVLVALERGLVAAGLGLDEVILTGHRRTPDGDIFTALDLAHQATLLSFDVHAATARIERLPAVKSATIARVIPNGLAVQILERAPIAVWRLNESAGLVDATGRVIQLVAPSEDGHALGLPLIEGAGAGAEAQALFTALQAHPRVLARLKVASRVDERRWSLQLTGGTQVLLPARDEARALVRLTEAGTQGVLLDQPLQLIDLRSDRWVVALPRAPALPAANGGRS